MSSCPPDALGPPDLPPSARLPQPPPRRSAMRSTGDRSASPRRLGAPPARRPHSVRGTVPHDGEPRGRRPPRCVVFSQDFLVKRRFRCQHQGRAALAASHLDRDADAVPVVKTQDDSAWTSAGRSHHGEPAARDHRLGCRPAAAGRLRGTSATSDGPLKRRFRQHQGRAAPRREPSRHADRL